MDGRIQQNSLINTIHKENLAAQIISTSLYIQATTTLKGSLERAPMLTTNPGRISSHPKTPKAPSETSPKTCNPKDLSLWPSRSRRPSKPRRVFLLVNLYLFSQSGKAFWDRGNDLEYTWGKGEAKALKTQVWGLPEEIDCFIRV